MRLLILICICSVSNVHADTHLFICSGQSNMVALDVEKHLRPHLEAAFPKSRILIAKSATNGHHIANWAPGAGDYLRLMEAICKTVINESRPDTISFIWMQGETDTMAAYFNGYEKNLRGLYLSLKNDLKRKDINWVIGRISDCNSDERIPNLPHWNKVRAIQMAVADQTPKTVWVNTDDLNNMPNGTNDMHYTPEGYVTLGKRFADSAITLINGKP